MGTAAELNRFLASVEKRAYAMALTAVRNPEDALDIVQDVMFALARKYATKDSADWRPLFYRMLNNRIMDFHRAASSKRRWFGFKLGADGAADPVTELSAPHSGNPERRAALDTAVERVADHVGRLPRRQREAFMMRAWEGMDVKTAARAMRCSEGSVKTHYSRAVHALRGALEDLEELTTVHGDHNES